MPENFNNLLIKAVDDALSSLGKSSKKAVYFHLAKSFNIERKEIPKRVEDFTQAIEKIFGLGAIFLQVLIMKHIYEKAGVIFEWDERKKFGFLEYVNEARQRFQESKKLKKF